MAACLLLAWRSQGASQYWTNTLGGDFAVPGNWLNNTVPALADDANFTSNANYTVTVSATTNIANTFFNAAGGTVNLNISSGVTLTNTSSFRVGSASGASETVILNGGIMSAAGSSGGVTLGGGGVGTLIITNGTVMVGRTVIGDTTSAASQGRLVISGAGTVYTNIGAAAFTVGRVQQANGNSVVISNNATVYTGGQVEYSGGVTTATNNSVSVLSGATWNLAAQRLNAGGFQGLMTIDNATVTNAGEIIIGNSGIANTLVVTNGGKLYTGLGGSLYDIGRNNGAISNTVIVTGTGSKWDAGTKALHLGESGGLITNSALLILNGGVVSNLSTIYIADSGAGVGDLITVSNAGSQLIVNGSISIGQSSTNVGNSLVVADGAVLTNTGSITVGNSAGCSNDLYQVGGGLATCVVSNGAITLGNAAGANCNSMIVTNALLWSGGTVGVGGDAAATNNFISVKSGTVWNMLAQRLNFFGNGSKVTIDAGTVTNAGDIILGNGANNDSLVITNAGKLYTGLGGSIWEIGRNANSTGSAVLITGAGSTWDVGGRTITVSGTFGATTNNTLTVSSGGVFTNGSLAVNPNGSGNNVYLNNGRLAISTLTIYNGGTVQLGGGNNDEIADTAALAMNSGSVFDLNGQSETVDAFGGAGTITNTATGTTSTLTVGANNNGGTFTGLIQNGNGSLAVTKLGTGTLTLGGANTYGGGTTLTAGTLKPGANNALGTGAVDFSGSSSRTLDFNGFSLTNTLTEAVSGNNLVIANNGGSTATNSGNFLASVISDFTFNGTTDIWWSGQIYRTNFIGTITKNGVNKVTVTGSIGNNNMNWTAVGGTLVFGKTGSAILCDSATISGGTLQFNPNLTTSPGSDWAGQVNSGVTITSGTFDLNGTSGNNNRMQWIQGTGGLLTNSSATPATLTLRERAPGPYTNAETIGGNLSLNFQFSASAATFILTGTNTYTGNTTISAGTLALRGSGSISNTPNISIGAGAKFDVSGLSSVFTLASSQTLTASGAIGTINGNANLGSGTLAITYTNGTPTLTVTNGTVTFNNNALTVTVSGTALPPGTYKLFSAGNGGAVAGSVSSSIITVNGAGLSTTATPSLQIINGELYLVVGTTTLTLSSSANPSGYKDSINFTVTIKTNGVTAANAGGSVTFFTNSVAFTTNGLAGGTTNFTLSLLPRGTNLITAIYSGDASYLASTNTLNQAVTNHPSVAAPMTVTRTAGLSLKIALSDVATNWSDADGDPVTLSGINLVTTNSVNLATNSSWILYTNSPNVSDRISYSISDGFGGTNIGYINIVINSSVTGTNSIVGLTTGSTNVVKAYGIPGYPYILERATNLALAVWVSVSTNAAGTNGAISAADVFGDLGGTPPPSAYYRLKWQP